MLWGGSGDAGYTCTESKTLLTEESVTASGSSPSISATLSYSAQIDADTLLVTFDGTEYVVDKVDIDDGVYGYGGIDANGPVYSKFPFVILSYNGNTLYTQTEGTHSIKIEAYSIQTETTHCFDNAVKSVIDKSNSGYNYFTITDNNGAYTASIDVNTLVLDIVNYVSDGCKYVAIGRSGNSINGVEFRYSGFSQDIVAHVYFSALVDQGTKVGTFELSQGGSITYTELSINPSN